MIALPNPSYDQLNTGAPTDRVLSVDELSTMFNVSTKTVSRWRDEGLVGRRYVIDGRKRLGFLKSSVDRFVRQHPERIQRGAEFSRLTDDERHEIIEAARRLVADGHSPTEVIKRLAEQTERSVETIRYTVKRFDREQPDQAVFACVGQLSDKARELIYQQHRRGDSIDAIAKRFHRSPKTVRRVIREMRAERIMELPLDFMPSPEFKTRNAEQRFTGPMPESTGPTRKPKVPNDLPAYLASLYDTPLLTAEQEVHLFRKYNYLKYRTTKLREQLDLARPKVRLMTEIERLYEAAVATKNQIIKANLRLVVSIVKRYVVNDERLFDLVSDGNVSLMRAVEKFDYTRGFKFSTYASWAIKKNYAREFALVMRQRDRFKTSREETLFDQADFRGNPQSEVRDQRQREIQVQTILRDLDQRERHIIESRFGLFTGEEPKTLKEVGKEFGVSKERIRQIERRAMDKLRESAVTANLQL